MQQFHANATQGISQAQAVQGSVPMDPVLQQKEVPLHLDLKDTKKGFES